MIRAILDQPGVASVEPITLTVRAYRGLIEESKGFLALVEGVALLLALLVAFNAASITTDERAREHATMLAFGVPIRRILGIEVVESVILGIAGTIVGIVIGLGLVAWFMGTVMPETMPDLGFGVFAAPATFAVAFFVGVVVRRPRAAVDGAATPADASPGDPAARGVMGPRPVRAWPAGRS